MNQHDDFLPAKIKAAYRIPDAWRDLGLPGTPAKEGPSPLSHTARDGKPPKLCLYDEGRKWKVFATDEGGSVLDFVAAARRCGIGEAIRWCAERLALRPAASQSAGNGMPQGQPPAKKPEPWPTLRQGTEEEHAALARLRGFSREGIALAEARGLLRFGEYDTGDFRRRHWRGMGFWAVTDGSRRLVELRRLSGEPWPTRDGKRKAHCIGTGKAWPVGLAEALEMPVVAICEGAPDLVAAHHFLWLEPGAMKRVGVVAVLGAGTARLAPEALAALAGKHVRLFPHMDQAGREAAKRWAHELKAAGVARVDAFSFSGLVTAEGGPGKDLADVCRIDADCWEQHRKFQNLFSKI